MYRTYIHTFFTAKEVVTEDDNRPVRLYFERKQSTPAKRPVAAPIERIINLGRQFLKITKFVHTKGVDTARNKQDEELKWQLEIA